MLCLSMVKSTVVVAEIAVFYECTKCRVSGTREGNVVDLDGISRLVNLQTLFVQSLCFRASRLPSLLGTLRVDRATIHDLALPNGLKQLEFFASTFGRTTSLGGIVENLTVLANLEVTQSTNLLEIPTELGRLDTLKNLRLTKHCTMVGKVPSELGLLTNLAILA